MEPFGVGIYVVCELQWEPPPTSDSDQCSLEMWTDTQKHLCAPMLLVLALLICFSVASCKPLCSQLLDGDNNVFSSYNPVRLWMSWGMLVKHLDITHEHPRKKLQGCLPLAIGLWQSKILSKFRLFKCWMVEHKKIKCTFTVISRP